MEEDDDTDAVEGNEEELVTGDDVEDTGAGQEDDQEDDADDGAEDDESEETSTE